MVEISQNFVAFTVYMNFTQYYYVTKLNHSFLGTIFILRKDLGVVGGSENGYFPLLYVMKMSSRCFLVKLRYRKSQNFTFVARTF